MNIPGHCIIISPLLVNGTINFAIDIMVLLVPVTFLMEWNVSAHVKILTYGVYLTGSL